MRKTVHLFFPPFFSRMLLSSLGSSSFWDGIASTLLSSLSVCPTNLDILHVGFFFPEKTERLLYTQVFFMYI